MIWEWQKCLRRGNTVRAYSVERTLCDILRPHSHVDIQVVTEAFKRYAARTDKNMPFLFECARTTKVEKRIRAYLINLLQDTTDFITNNSKKAWKKGL